MEETAIMTIIVRRLWTITAARLVYLTVRPSLVSQGGLMLKLLGGPFCAFSLRPELDSQNPNPRRCRP